MLCNLWCKIDMGIPLASLILNLYCVHCKSIQHKDTLMTLFSS